MSRREKEKKASLDALAKLAYSVGGGAPAPPPRAEERRSSLPTPAPKPVARPPPPPPPKTPAEIEAERRRRQQMEDRRAKLEEERMLRERRQRSLQQNANLQWRGMDNMGVPASIRRTGFDRTEPDLRTKLSDILGDPAEKEGRVKNRERGKRHGGG